MATRLIVKAKPDRLEFGCGPSLTPGYTGVDIRFFKGVTFICNAWQIDKYVQQQSVSEIRSRHFFEHLTFAQGRRVLQVWHKLLRPGGSLQLIIPDIDYHVRQIVNTPEDSSEINPKVTNIQHGIAGLYGWQRGGFREEWDTHKSGYTFKMLNSLLHENNFKAIQRMPDAPWNLNVTAHKDYL